MLYYVRHVLFRLLAVVARDSTFERCEFSLLGLTYNLILFVVSIGRYLRRRSLGFPKLSTTYKLCGERAMRYVLQLNGKFV